MMVLVRNWLLALMALAALIVAVLSQQQMRTDLSFFLPESRTPETQMLSAMMQNAKGGSVVLIALDGGDPQILARASQDVASALEASGLFNLVANGAPRIPESLFAQARAWRYLIGPAWNADTFDADTLPQAVHQATQRLATAKGWAFRESFAWDPFNRMGALMRLDAGSETPPRHLGVWMNDERSRAVLMAHALAPGDDIFAQLDIRAALDHAVEPWAEHGVSLRASGPGMFAIETRGRIHAEMRILSILATVLVLTILGLAFRRLSTLAALGLPLVAAVFAGAGVVQLLFGSIHGVALTFGVTVIGVAADYPIHLFTHQKDGEPACLTVKRLLRPLALSAATTIAGFLALSPSSFRGLAQLGVLAAVGIFTAAAVSYWILPHLIGPGRVQGGAAWAQILSNHKLTRRLRVGLVAFALAVVAGALQTPAPLWEGSLANLSPIAQSSKDLDRDLRQALRAPGVRHVLAVTGDSAEQVLSREEALQPALDALVAKGQLGGYTIAATLLPSQATQRARQADLPDAETLSARLNAAAANLRPGLFQPFIDEVERQRTLPPITAEAFLHSSLGWRLAPLLQQTDQGSWRGHVLLSQPGDIAALQSLENPDGAVTYMDMKAVADTLITDYRGEAFQWLGLGALAAFVILTLGLGRPRKAVRAALPAALAIALTVSTLAALGISLSLFHILALLLVAGIGVDYTLFFNTFRGDIEEHAQSFRAIVLCNATTISVFAVLALSTTPVLAGIGLTVALGAGLSLLLTYAFGHKIEGI